MMYSFLLLHHHVVNINKKQQQLSESQYLYDIWCIFAFIIMFSVFFFVVVERRVFFGGWELF